MIVGIMQPYFMPYIGYYQLINSVDKFVILDDVNFIKRGWTNRNYILSNGQKFRFTLPLQKQSQNRLFNEILVQNEFHHFLQTLRHSYCRAPYYREASDIINNAILSSDNFCDMTVTSIREVMNYLSINTEILISSKLDKNNNLRGEERIINICKCLNASTYINPIGGKDLYNKQRFSSECIELRFLQPGFTPYPQIKSSEFVPGLSIIDLLMNCDRASITDMLHNYTLI